MGFLFSIFVLVSETTSITVLRVEQSCAWQCGLRDTGVVTHGVCLGQTYHTEHKCQEFASIIGETMSDDFVEALRSCRYMSVLVDGSTDSSVMEKEPFYFYV